jgi:Signal transduction histidine kinase
MLNNNILYNIENFDDQYIRTISKKNKLVNDLIKYIPHPCVILDSDFKIIASNALLRDFFNLCDDKENIRDVFEELFKEGQFEVFLDWFHIFFNNSMPIRNILLDGSKDNLFQKIQLSGSLIPVEDTLYLLLTINDLTNSLDETSKLFADKNENLKEALIFERRKSEFFLNISHDLRTPLNVILGTVQLSELNMKNITDSSFEIMERRIGVIKQNCYRLLKLVNNLIDISRLEVGYKSVELCNFDIVGKIKEIVTSITEYAENKTLTLSFSSDTDALEIACDTDKIERIMYNLLSNAIKFSNQGGKINVSIDTDKNWVTIIVQDNGIGIPKEKMKYIFKRFKQVNDDLTSRSGGSGIGLSLVKSLVELLKGSISLESSPNVGSTFIIKFPNKKLSARSSRKYAKIAEANVKSNLERVKIEFSDI